ncbi:SDR family oxidoreductase [Amycolatopsis sp. ATCC 39116]|uniref:SDR family oxidoreductase n=1 Tax=Amycolatopsis sp. (strain ATCC 39116 / 75iv2) TaxID=385957 RepID=UPI000262558B|nr:SDR family oxidoreductase [Amycolatopsis sp. ATCC 39116]
MTIVVTGATGNLGRLVIDALLERGAAASEIIAPVRSPEKATDLATPGVLVREADYRKPATLAGAFAGADKLLLISSSAVGQRVDQHRNVIDAAKTAGIGLITYTSMLRAQSSPMALAVEHKTTEQLIERSGLPFVFLRNGWYLENYTENLGPAMKTNVIFGSAGNGRVAGAARADYAAAAAAVLLEDGHENRTYELGGDEPFTLAELAAEVSRQSGTHIAYQDLPPVEYTKLLVDAGVPEAKAEMLTDSDLNTALGHLDTSSRDLSRLIGRPTTPLADVVAAALNA